MAEVIQVPMKRGGMMPMLVDYDAYFENEPDGQGWVVEVNGVHFSRRDAKDRSSLVDCEKLQQQLADKVDGDARENGWRRPRPLSQPYYR